MTRAMSSYHLLIACGIVAATAVGFVGTNSHGPKSTSQMPVTISFAARVGHEPFDCGDTYQSWTPTDLRLFVSDLRLITESGIEQPIVLDEDGQWQSQGVALLDFEDGTGACLNGTAETRTIVTGHVPTGVYNGITFSIGVPFELNHQDPTSGAAPLNLTSMHWHWRAGHKFLRFGAKTTTGDNYEIHLGSTDCQGTIANITGCNRPNRPWCRLSGYNPAVNVIVFDIEKLLDNVLITKDEINNGRPGCMSAADDPGCVPVFKNLGLDLQTGAPTGQNAVCEIQ